MENSILTFWRSKYLPLTFSIWFHHEITTTYLIHYTWPLNWLCCLKYYMREWHVATMWYAHVWIHTLAGKQTRVFTIAWYYSTTRRPMHTCSQLHILPIDPFINLILLNYAQPIYIISWIQACGMQFICVTYSAHVWIGSFAEDRTQVYRMGGIYSSTKAPMNVVLVTMFLTYGEYYSNFLMAKPFILDLVYLIPPSNNNHLCNPLYVVSQLVKMPEILYEAMTYRHRLICTYFDSCIGQESYLGLYRGRVLFYH